MHISTSAVDSLSEALVEFPAAPLDHNRVLIPIDCSHPWRRDLEMFIAAQYQTIFNALPKDFPSLLLGQRDNRGNWIVGVGLRNAQGERLLLENYLGEPVEQALGRLSGRNTPRREIVELGSFAISDWRRLRWAFTEIAHWCLKLGYRWISCTATSHLERLFRSYGIEPQFLAEASPEQLPDDASIWGRYYQTAPRVLVAPVYECCSKLKQRSRKTRASS